MFRGSSLFDDDLLVFALDDDFHIYAFLFYQISYNRLLMKKKEMANEEKHKVVQECIDAIGEKYAELAYKHDGCRVL